MKTEQYLSIAKAAQEARAAAKQAAASPLAQFASPDATAAYDASVAAAAGKRGAAVLRAVARKRLLTSTAVEVEAARRRKLALTAERAAKRLAAADADLAPLRAAVRTLSARLYRTSSIDVRIAKQTTAFDTATESRDRYSTKWHKFYGPALVHEQTFYVPTDWLDTVQSEGIAQCDGMLTLSASKVKAPAGYSAWNATWAVQGKGYALSTGCGVIIRADGRDAETAHAHTVADGVALLRRRARARYVENAAANADLSKYTSTLVHLHHGAAVGLCDTGMRSWCARAGIDPHAGATVGQILVALSNGAGQDRLAMLACRRAIRPVVAAGSVAE